MRHALNRIPSPEFRSKGCRHPSGNWLCLCCKEVLCGRYVNKHMRQHFQQTSHCLALSFSDLSVWCSSCNSYINAQVVPQLRPVYEAAYILKFGEAPPIRNVELRNVTASSMGEDELLNVAVSGRAEARTCCGHLASVSSDLLHIPSQDRPCNRGYAECHDELQCSFQTIEEDKDVGNMQNADLVDADSFVGDLVVTQCGQIYTEENCQTRITESLPRGFHFEEMEGVIKSDFNGSRVSSANPMELLKEPETPKRAESPRIYSDEEQTNEKVKKQEFALRNVKPECVSWDESAATAKLLERKAHVAAGSSSKRTNREEIEHAQVTALARPTTKNTKSSVNPPHLNLVNVLVGIFLLIAIAAIFTTILPQA